MRSDDGEEDRLMKHAALAVMLGLALTGCGSAPEPTEAYCTSFGPAATYQWQACNAGCALASQAQAHDLDLNTTATIVPQAGQTTYTTKLTATSVADIASGAVPGVFVTEPNATNFVSLTRSMRTINNGVQVETLGDSNTEVSRAEDGTPAAGFLGMRTTQAFDQVEYTVTVTWGAGDVPTYLVYEICSDGGNV
jgi:hypothetical protein